MPDIEDIIEGLAPFAFILIWIFSAVVGRAKEQPPAKTTRPVFAPPRPTEMPATRVETAQAARETGQKVDWSQLDTQNPYNSENFDPSAAEAERSAAQAKQEQLAKALRDQKKREAAAARREAEAARNAAAARKAAAEQAAKKQQQLANKPVDIFHLVSDHAAETHLEHALTDRPAGSSATSRKTSMAMASIISGMQDRDSVRKALIMSIVLGEPKCKVGRGPGA